MTPRTTTRPTARGAMKLAMEFGEKIPLGPSVPRRKAPPTGTETPALHGLPLAAREPDLRSGSPDPIASITSHEGGVFMAVNNAMTWIF